MEDTYTLWQKQKGFLDSEKIKYPDLFQRAPLINTQEVLKLVGITALPTEQPLVYLRLWPQDFIVEEISRDGSVHTVDYAADQVVSDSEGLTVYADLVKIGISTLDAADELAKVLATEKKNIGYAGIKDRDAITSQFLSFRNISAKVISAVSAPNFFLKNIYQGKGAIQVGDLQGNKFTLVLRGTEPFATDALKSKLRDYEKNGFWNFYYTQRFGTPRLIAHLLGLLVLERKYEDVLKTFLTFQSPSEIGYFSDIRKSVLEHWNNWPKIISILEPLSFSFRRELSMFDFLIKHPGDFLGALKLYPEHIQIWVMAYTSYLFNCKLSMLIKEDRVPEQLPIVLSTNRSHWEFYRDLLSADSLAFPAHIFRDLPWIQLKERMINTRQKFEFLNFVVNPDKPQIGVIGFSLPKGSYATTLLSHFFTLSFNVPIPAGIDPEVVDSKKILGTGSVTPVSELFKDVIHSKLEVKEEMSDEAAA